MRRLVTRLVAVLALVAAGLLVPVAGEAPSSTAQAANLAYFDPGNIISDAVFYDYLSMRAPDIQAFLNAKNASCVPGSDGTACIRNYVVGTTDRVADSLCAGYSGVAGGESAATIIAKVAVSCRVSPRVLLVLLQKEQGLVSGSRPTAHTYDRAAGYACPDSGNGWCDPAYGGLENQLYKSGWQYRRYQSAPTSYPYVAGRNNTIQWSPSASCGSSSVYIANQATAGLYDYTPYRPNQNALNAGYGSSSDPCASYGNRNFWNYFTDWFGSTQSTGAGAILLYWQNSGGASGPLGNPTSSYFCGLRYGGCGQHFERGSIYWSPGTGAHSLAGGVRDGWAARGWENSSLGYPVSDTNCGLTRGGCFQDFENGSLYWSPGTGAYFVRGVVRAAWGWNGWENGVLGYPVTDEVCGLRNGGCFNHFENGSIYFSPATGPQAVPAALRAPWGAKGWENGPLGYPTGAYACGLPAGGCAQDFQGGRLYWSPGTGGSFVRGLIAATWAGNGGPGGSLGYPVTDEICGLRDGGCFNHFQGGSIYFSPATGAHAVPAGLRDAWSRQGWETGALGYPTGDATCGLAAGGCVQTFQGGTFYWSPSTGGHVVRGLTGATWLGAGGPSGYLGYPITDEFCGLRNGGCFQHYQGGSVYWSPATGAHAVPSGLRTGWTNLGWENGTLGYPVGDTRCGLAAGGCYQDFQGGRLYYTPASGSHLVRGAIAAYWGGAGGEGGWLGYPVTDEFCGLRGGGCFNHFQNGSVYWSPTTGTHAVAGAIRDAWAAQGWETGAWGYPTGEAQPTSTGATQRFAGGTVTYDSTTGSVTIR